MEISLATIYQLLVDCRLFIALVFGLIAGDYIFQPKKMAITKGEKGKKGFLTCVLHCLVFTFATMAFIYCKWWVLLLMFALVYRGKYSGEYTWLTVWMLLVSTLHFDWSLNILYVFLAIFFSHWFIDRYSLASWILKLIEGRDFMAEYKAAREARNKRDAYLYNACADDLVDMQKFQEEILAAEETHSELTIPFATNVYIIVDNGLHLIVSWWLLHELMRWGVVIFNG